MSVIGRRCACWIRGQQCGADRMAHSRRYCALHGKGTEQRIDPRKRDRAAFARMDDRLAECAGTESGAA